MENKLLPHPTITIKLKNNSSFKECFSILGNAFSEINFGLPSAVDISIEIINTQNEKTFIPYKQFLYSLQCQTIAASVISTNNRQIEFYEMTILGGKQPIKTILSAEDKIVFDTNESSWNIADSGEAIPIRHKIIIDILLNANQEFEIGLIVHAVGNLQ